jgi:tetrahydromethanopterin S-methyltransferase subunit G
MFFNKPTIQLNNEDLKAIESFVDTLATHFNELHKRIDTLEAEVAFLKKTPRQSFRALLREKGIK